MLREFRIVLAGLFVLVNLCALVGTTFAQDWFGTVFFIIMGAWYTTDLKQLLKTKT